MTASIAISNNKHINASDFELFQELDNINPNNFSVDDSSIPVLNENLVSGNITASINQQYKGLVSIGSDSSIPVLNENLVSGNLNNSNNSIDTISLNEGNGAVINGTLPTINSQDLAVTLADKVSPVETIYFSDRDDNFNLQGLINHNLIAFLGAGNDFFKFGNGDDKVKGEAGNDFINGGLGNDIIEGNGGSDILYGGLGDDKIFGGKGDDVIVGGLGQDALSGGEGKDIFIFAKEDSIRGKQDTIRDFVKGEDKIELDFITSNHITFSQKSLKDGGLYYRHETINGNDYTVVKDSNSDFGFKIEGKIVLDDSDFIF